MMKPLARIEIRSEPVDIFTCLKCFDITKTSDIGLFNTNFCQKCYDSKVDTQGRKVISWGGNKFRAYRQQRKVVCALCNCEYDLLPKSFTPSSIKEQKSNHDRFLIERKKWAGLIDNFNPNPPPFMPVNYDEEISPLGWTNDLLCRRCLVSFYEHNYEQLQQENADFDIQKAENRAKEIKTIESKRAEDKGLMIGIFIFLLLILIVALDRCSFTDNSNAEPTEIYHRR